MSKSKTQIVAEMAPEKMTDEQLAIFVSTKAANIAIYCEQLKPYYLDLRNRFHAKQRAATIYGCRTWDEYCEKVLNRTRRAVNYFLAGGNPVRKRNPGWETVSQPHATVPVKVKILTTKHTYSAVHYVKQEPDPAPKVLPVSSLSVPTQLYPPVQEAVDQIIKALRFSLATANVDPCEREAFRELLAKHLDAVSAELRQE